MTATAFDHDPVMCDEIVAAFATVPAGVIIDATLGGGGHSEALLQSRPDVDVIGLDRDPAAIEAASQRLARFGDRFSCDRVSFDMLGDVLDRRGIRTVSAVLFDLGVSSHQLDTAARGFSYRAAGPIDMRMDPDSARSAADLIDHADVDELTAILRRNADERFARRIAQVIVAARPIADTAELASIIAAAIPAPARRTGGHPATRTFQALRIEVNGELEQLPIALDAAITRLAPSGRLAVLSYHSGEDRIVASVMRDGTDPCTCPTGYPCVCGATPTLARVRDVPKRPGAAECGSNPRASSARLRVVERTAATNGQMDEGVSGGTCPA